MLIAGIPKNREEAFPVFRDTQGARQVVEWTSTGAASGDAPWLGEEASTIVRRAGESGSGDTAHQPVARNVRPGCRRAERCAREGCMYAYGPRAVSLTR